MDAVFVVLIIGSYIMMSVFAILGDDLKKGS